MNMRITVTGMALVVLGIFIPIVGWFLLLPVGLIEIMAGLIVKEEAALEKPVASFLVIVLTLYVAMSPIYVRGALTGTVSGTVVDEHGRGMRNVQINVHSSDGAYVKSGSTSSGGSFNINLDVGKSYTLDFSKEGYAKVIKTATLSVYLEEVKLGTIVLFKALRLSSPVLSRVASPGEKLALPFTVGNIGEEMESVEFSVAKPEGWSTRILDQVGEVAKISLSSGVSMSLQLEVAIPVASTGDYNLSLTAAGKTISTLNFTVIVEPLGEPLIFCQFPGKSAAPSESAKFQVRVKNPFDVRLRLQVAVDSVPNGWMAIVKIAGGEAVTEVNLDSNEFADLTIEVYVPREEADGDYDLIFKASSSVTSEDLALTVNVEKTAAGMGVDLQAMPPYLDAYAGSRAKFGLKLTNGGGHDQLFDLTIMGLPQDLRAWFEGSEGVEMTRIYIEAGESEEFGVVVSVYSGMELGALDFTVSAASLSVTKSVGLTLNVLGLYRIDITNRNFYTTVTVGGETSYGLTVRNTGTEVVTNLDVATTGNVPSGFAVDIKPTIHSSLRPEEEATFTITVATEPDVNAGNYYVDFEVQSDQTESSMFSLRIGVEQQMTWIYIGGGLVVVAVIILFIIYRRFGRR